MKVVINMCFGGFGLSDAAYEKLIEWGIPVKKYDDDTAKEADTQEIIFDRSLDVDNEFNGYPNILGRYWVYDIFRKNRSHPLLVKVVETLGEDAGAKYSQLKVVEIPDDVEYTIEEYDGNEHIAEKHRTWY